MPFFFYATLFVLLLAAIITQENFVFSLFYIVLAVYFTDQLWKNRVGRGMHISRQMQSHAFPDEEVRVNLTLKNQSIFPLVWGRLREGLPPGVSLRLFHQVISIAPRQAKQIQYAFKAQKRGIYEIGPLTLTYGDLLGFSTDKNRHWDQQPLIVYPTVYPLADLGLPSISPVGNKRYHQPIFEDPSRPVGKRDYQRGDSIRRIDWKSSAAVGAMQVKIYEPAVSLETAIFLDLNLSAYPQKRYFDAIELAISTAASVANAVIEMREAVGLFSNGFDPLASDKKPQCFQPAKGVSHLMQCLESLARIQAHETYSLENLIHEQYMRLAWGSTMVVITGKAEALLFDVLIQCQRCGLQIVLVLIGEIDQVHLIKAQAAALGLTVHHLLFMPDLKNWQG